MNTITVQKIKNVGKFIEIGNRIRNRQELLVPRSEDLSILKFVEQTALKKELFAASVEGNEGRLLTYIENGIGFIGWYECDEDLEIHQSLIDEADDWFKANSVTEIFGPVNGSTWGQYRFNLDCEYPLFVGEPFQPLFYIDFWEYTGFETHLFYKTEQPPKSLLQETTVEAVEAHFLRNGMSIHHFPKQLGIELENELYAFYDKCFITNPLYSKIELESYRELSRKIEGIIETRLSYFLRNKAGEIIAVFVCYRDIYHELKSSAKEHQSQKLILKTIATHPNYQNQKIGTIMVNLIHNRAYEMGFDQVIHAMMFSGNITSKVGSKKFNTKVLRTYSLLKKEV